MEPLNPYQAPDVVEGLKPLGSLAQSARGKEIKQARGILIAIGILTMGANGFMLYNTPKEVEQVIQASNLQPNQVEEFRQVVTGFCRMVYGGALALGFLFLIFGLIVKKYPVPITITSLVLYLLATALFGFLNPLSLAQGLIVKILIVVGLVRAIKAARAYESHTRKVAVADESLG